MNEGASLYDFGQTEPKAQPLQPQGIDWKRVLQGISALSNGSTQQPAMQFPGIQAQQSQGSTAPIYQLPQMQIGKKQQAQTSPEQIEQYAKYISLLFS